MIKLIPDQTIFIQLAIFLFTFFCLKYLVFNPVLRLIALRKQKTVGAEEAAAELNAKTETLISDYSQKIQDARHKGLTLKDMVKKEGEQQAGEILKEGRKLVEAAVDKTKKEISQQTKEAQLVLKKYSRDLSREMAEKLLGRKVAAE